MSAPPQTQDAVTTLHKLILDAARVGKQDPEQLALLAQRLRGALDALDPSPAQSEYGTYGTYVPYGTIDRAQDFEAAFLRKREFMERQVTPLPLIQDFEAAAEEACGGDASTATSAHEFELSEHQSFVRNFLCPRSPYNGLLLYHDVGVGKTCSAIAVAERFQDRQVTIIAPVAVQKSFRQQMFDASRVTLSAQGTLRSVQCTKDAFLPRGLDGKALLAAARADGSLTPEQQAMLDAHATRVINQRFTFMGPTKFANHVARKSPEELAETYRGHVIIVDEAHNLRSQRDNSQKPSYKALMRVLRAAAGTKLLLMSATPMFNDAREIVDLLNLLLCNDGRPLLERKRIFSDESVLLDASSLQAACVGYVSHVSGRNPLRFPILFDPRINNDPAVLKPSALPTIDISGNPLKPGERMTKTHTCASRMSAVQYKNYAQHADQLSSSSVDDDLQQQDEEEGESDDASSPSQEDVKGEDSNGEDVNGEDVNDLPKNFRPGFEAANLHFPGTPMSHIGKTNAGSAARFWSCFRKVPNSKDFVVEYIPGSAAAMHQGFLAPRNLHLHSCKFQTIIDRILASEGVIFVYSRFLWAGLVPLAIALEHAGFMRHGQHNILKQSSASGPKVKPQGAYIMLTSDVRLCTRAAFQKDLAAAVSPANEQGQLVRVILACGVATEGIDFKCVRAVHLLDPWYHSNKVHQIVGRASRNCSHKALPVKKRNVTVYLHTALPPENVSAPRETVDVHAYRISEIKQAKIQPVEDILKATAVDCIMNRHSQQQVALAQAVVEQVTSQGTHIKKYRIAQGLPAAVQACHQQAAADAIERKTKKRLGADVSTYDPMYHAPDLLKVYLRAILDAFQRLHRHVLSMDELAAFLPSLLAKRTDMAFDDLLFTAALQEGVRSKQLEYRGGMYVQSRAPTLLASTCPSMLLTS